MIVTVTMTDCCPRPRPRPRLRPRPRMLLPSPVPDGFCGRARRALAPTEAAAAAGAEQLAKVRHEARSQTASKLILADGTDPFGQINTHMDLIPWTVPIPSEHAETKRLEQLAKVCWTGWSERA